MDYPLFISISDYGVSGTTGTFPSPPKPNIFYVNITNVSGSVINNTFRLKESSIERYINIYLYQFYPGDSESLEFDVSPSSELYGNNIVVFLVEPVENRVVSNTVTFVNQYQNL